MAREDWYGLFEVVDASRTLSLDKTEREVFELARAAIDEMLDSGYIYLCRFKHVGNKEVPIDPADVEEILRNPANWKRPQALDAEYVAFAGTAAADRL